MGALVPIVPLIIDMPWTDIRYVLTVGDAFDLVDFILDDTGPALSLLPQKPLVSVCPKYDSLFIFLILPP